MGITPLSINFEVPLIFIDSGQPASTSETVPFIRKQREDHPEFVDKIMDTLNAISALSLDALKSRSLGLLGNLMLEYYVELKKLDISTDKLDEIVGIAMKNGALGAKPTGGWGGGCCIALAKDQEQADMLAKAYRDNGFNSFQAKVGVEGISVVG
jgi:mevalonate kinase